MEMDAHTGFSEVLRSRKARDTNELVSLYAALIAHGTELDARSVAAMIPQLDPAHISTAMRFLEMPGRLPRANDRVVGFQRTHPITELWGTGRQASSNSMSLDTSPHLFYARVDPRRRTHAVGMYTHVLDQHGIVYNQPIVLNERQAGVAIEGVIRHNENRDNGGLLRLSVDTHGFVVTWTSSSFRHLNEAYRKQQNDRLAGRPAQGVARSGPASRATSSTDSRWSRRQQATTRRQWPAAVRLPERRQPWPFATHFCQVGRELLS
ncbi:hypothetical protein OKW43_007912 [Paraburkholderia sp. WC7.3g]